MLEPIIYSILLFITVYTVFVTKGKPESDRHEALVISRENFIRFKQLYYCKTSQHNPITTGYFSIILSLPFKDLRYLYSLFWVSVYGIMFYEGISIIWLLLLFPLMIRTALYRLEELYFIMIPVYFALQGYWYLWATVLFWRVPLTSIAVLRGKLNKKALVLDYCLFGILLLTY